MHVVILLVILLYSATEQKSTVFYNFVCALILTSNEQK